MKKFIEKMHEVLDTEDKISMETKLEDIFEWDSLSSVSFLAMADATYGKKIKLDAVKQAKTIADLFALVQ